MTTTFNLTKHAEDRAKERMNMNFCRANKKFDKAIKNGKASFNYYTSNERNYLEERSSESAIALAYEGYCYIVGYDGSCVTLFELPKWWDKKKHYNGKERIKHPKKYYKNYNYLEEACLA